MQENRYECVWAKTTPIRGKIANYPARIVVSAAEIGVLPPLLQLGRSEDVLLRQLTASILCELASEKSCKEELIRNGGPTRLLLGMARQIHRRVARP